MFKLVLIIIISGIVSQAFSQTYSPDILNARISVLEKQEGFSRDTTYYNLKNQLGFYLANNVPDSAIQYLADLPSKLAQIKYHKGEVEALKILGTAYQTKGDFVLARDYFSSSIKKAEEHQLMELVPALQSNIGNTYVNQGKYTEALENFYEALKGAEKYENDNFVGTLWNNIGVVHFFQGNLDESIRDYQKKLTYSQKSNDVNGEAMAFNNIGETYLAKKDYANATENFRNALSLAKSSQNTALLIASNKNLGSAFTQQSEYKAAGGHLKVAYELAKDSGNLPALAKVLIELAKNQENQESYEIALNYGLEAVKISKEMGQIKLIRDSNGIVSRLFEQLGKEGLALKAYKEFKLFGDSLKNVESEKSAILLKSEFEFSRKELEFKRKELQQKWLLFSFVALLFSVLVILWITNRNRKRIKKNNDLLSSKNEAIESQKKELEHTLQKLKKAQKQLIQSEKMASLGELTAGIAHEIQNPLNFVNNFSEVSAELLDEVKEEINAENWSEVKEILGDVNSNLNKIKEHGQHASSIVTGMLQHSRNSPGELELLDINTLVESAVKLAFHGHRALNSSFNVHYEVDADTSIAHVKVVKQDIDRVLFNLINNAFQALGELSDAEGKKGKLNISTYQLGAKVHISIKDNGKGIPSSVLDKIFQPFFTTKPAGKGTGLGLSIAYDIAQAHGGDLIAQSIEGDGAEFILILNAET